MIEFRTDTRLVLGMLNYFKNSDWIRSELNALKKVGRLLVKENKANFKSKLPAATKRNGKYSDRLIDAVRMSKVKRNPEQLSLKVHTMGTLKTGSGTFRARMFNNSKERVRHTKPFTDSLGRNYKRGRSTGVLLLLHFFNDRSDINDSLDKEIAEAILKVNQKKFKK